MKWRPVKIRALCKKTGTVDPRRNPDAPFYYIDISGIDRNAKCIGTTAEILGADAPSRARQIVQKDDVLVSTVRPNLNAVAMVPDHLDGQIASTGFCVLRARENCLLPRFLFYFTRTEPFIGTLLQHVRGANYPAVTDRNVLDVEIPWPAVTEQRRIVEILDQTDTLRKKRAEADAKAARILPALFYKMFGDPLTLATSGGGVPLGDLEVDIQNGFACGEKDVEGGVPHLRMNNIDDAGVLNLELVRTVPLDRDTERYRLAERDVLFMGTNSEDKIGKTCLFLAPDDRTYLFSNHLVRIRVSDARVTPEYLAGFLHLLWSKKFFPAIAKRWVNQSSVAIAALSALRIPIPETEPLGRFTSMYRDLLSLRERRVHSGQRIDRVFSVLLHRAFTGDLTAKWREAHIKELLAEMEAQTKALEAPAEDASAPKTKGKRHAGHDIFNKAALAAYIVAKCHAPNQPIGRVKLAKLFYLVQRRTEMTLTESFARRAAGPVDDDIHKFLNLAKKQSWVRLPAAQGDFKPVEPGANSQPAIDQVAKRWSAVVSILDNMLEKMMGWGWEALERWATVEPVARGLVEKGETPTAQNVRQALAQDAAWRDKLNRDTFSESNISSTLAGLRMFGFLPQT